MNRKGRLQLKAPFLFCITWFLEGLKSMKSSTQDALLSKPVPSVSLPATDGSTVTLKDLEGVTVVYAYPRTSPRMSHRL